MWVNLNARNPALVSLLENPGQTIFLDANFLIPPDRTKVGAKPITFQKYSQIWLDPVFDAFSNLAMHESVYGELVAEPVKNYVDVKCKELPPGLTVYLNTGLTTVEMACMQTYINRIVPFSKYIPQQDNSDDRDNKGLRLLYKYQYYLTKRERLQNPEWGEFIEKMNRLYSEPF